MKSIEWLGPSIRFVDQTLLPLEETYVTTADYSVVAEAIRTLRIRGAPLIGIAAAYGVAAAAAGSPARDADSLRIDVMKAVAELRATRPTARNLFWALNRMEAALRAASGADELRRRAAAEAVAIHEEDRAKCLRIGANGAALIPGRCTILTHCNTGALATGGEGTAQAVITEAHRSGKSVRVFVDETRPLLQGSRLTAWELQRAGVEASVITDNSAAALMQMKKVDLVITGADRIAANGDTANKIGTYGLAVLAGFHGIPMYVAAPVSTIDAGTARGSDIPVEERDAAEVTRFAGARTAPEGVDAVNYAFDVTPSRLISAIITDAGVFRPPYDFRGGAAD